MAVILLGAAVITFILFVIVAFLTGQLPWMR